MIAAAILGFEEQKRHIDSQIGELRTMLNGGSAPSVTSAVEPTHKRSTMSAAARKRIGDAQRKRWAAAKTQSQPAASEAPKKKRRLSLAGRRAIIAATKKRWALIRAAKAAEAKGRPAAKKTARKTTVIKTAA